jgi:predicted ATPase
MRVVTGGASPLGGQRAGSAGTSPETLRALLAVLGDHAAAQRLLERNSVAGNDSGARDRIARELVEAVGQLAARRPLAILMDDLQWADELTLAVLRAIPDDWIAARPLLWICAVRGDAGVALGRCSGRRDVVSIQLEPLRPSATAELLGDVLALDSIDPEVAGRLHEAALGNPLHVLELVRLGLDEGWLWREAPGRLHVAGDAALPLPASFADLTARRLRVLHGPGRELLEAGAVLGRSFAEPVVCAVAGIPEAEGLDALADLIAREVWIAEPAAPDVRFASDLLAEQIYAGVPAARRAQLHARAARTLAGSAPRAGLAAVLAHHWWLAGDTAREQAAREAAAAESLARAAFEEARAHLTRTVVLDAGCANAAPVETRVRWHIELARCAHALADPEAMEREARAALGALGVPLPEDEESWRRLVLRRLIGRLAPVRVERDPLRRERERLTARAADTIVHHFYYRDDLPAMVGAALVATRAAEHAGDVALAARSWMVLASLCGLLRLHDAAERHFTRGQAAAWQGNDRSEQAYCLATRAVYHANFGDFAGAQVAVDEAERCLEGVDDPFQREIVLTMRGHVAHFRGRHDEARAAFEAVLASACARRNVQREAWGRFSLGRTDLAEERNEAALRELEAARALLAQAPELQSEVICWGLLACARMRCGDEEGALAAARAAAACIERSRPSGFPSVAGYAALAETWAALARRRSEPSLLDAQRSHLRAFRRFTRWFPMATPAYDIACAAVRGERGARRRARARLRRATSRARLFGMALEEQRATRALEALERAQTSSLEIAVEEATR